jgi:hypothetical protein
MVGSVRTVTVRSKIPGEINGPAVTVEVTVRNRSGHVFDLTGLAVNAFSRGSRPADPSAAGSTPLSGPLPPGRSAKGTYAFRMAAEDVGTLRLEVASDRAATILQFER